jgi:hypothetical protein
MRDGRTGTRPDEAVRRTLRNTKRRSGQPVHGQLRQKGHAEQDGKDPERRVEDQMARNDRTSFDCASSVLRILAKAAASS